MPRRAAAAPLLAIALAATSLAACRDDAPRGGGAAPHTPAVELRETAEPGDRYTVAEVATIERILHGAGTVIVHEAELGKHLEVEVVQVEPDGLPVRYRKHFTRFRQRTATRVDGHDEPLDQDALTHPVEGHTLEYAWRGETLGWSVNRVAGEARSQLPGDALPETFASRTHPWLPGKAVSVGEQWTATELPLSLPDVPPAHVQTQLRLARIEPRKREQRVAHIDVVVRVEPPADAPPDALRGELAGRLLFVIPDEARRIPGRMLREQLGGSLHAQSASPNEPAVELRVVIFRATDSEAR